MIRVKEQLTWLTALLSSSCCIIQLVLNYFSISCAGFAILTPYRPLFTSITLLLLSYNVIQKKKPHFSIIVSVLLMMSPEIIQYMNQSPSSSTTMAITTSYKIQLSGLGCEACANRIKNTLNSVDWIIDTRVFFDNQTAIVETIKVVGSTVLEEMIKNIDISKYDAQVLDSWST